MNSFLLTTPLDFICFDTIRQQFILDEHELDCIPISQLLLKEKRYIALQRVGWDRIKKPLYLYDIVINDDSKEFFIDSYESNLYLCSVDEASDKMHYYPEYASNYFTKKGSMLPQYYTKV